jgi:hypothetical protein
MKAKTAMMAKKPSLAVAPASTAADDTSSAIGTLARAVSDVAEEVRPLYHIESLADNAGHLSAVAAALESLANATAMSVIAKNGSEEDRAIAVAHLKGWFEDFRK